MTDRLPLDYTNTDPSVPAASFDEFVAVASSALAGPGWSVPDQALHRYPLDGWAPAISAAVRVLEVGGTDREALTAFADALTVRKGRSPDLVALERSVYVRKLRQTPRRPPSPPPGVHVGPR